jgi:hypothetical protein
MAIVMRMRWDGVTPEQYDQVWEIAGWERDAPTGALLHQSWFVGDQLNVCDVWDTADDFNAFVGGRLMPAVAQVGMVGQPNVEVLPAYNWQFALAAGPGAVVEEDSIPAGPYQALEAKVGWREVPPTGGISHIATIDGDMAKLVSVWEDPAALETFANERIGPAAAALGFPPPEEGDVFYPLHNLFAVAGVPADR